MFQISWRRWIAVLFIGVGLILVIVFGVRTFHSFQQIRYIESQGFDDGTASIEAIEPWMSARFVAVAYGVPEEYLFDRLGIEYRARDANAPLARINRRLRLGREPVSDDPEILDRVGQIILEYRADPVTVELGRIEPWMSINYIANSTGVPAETLLTALGLPDEDDLVHRPLNVLDRDPEVRLPRMPETIRRLQEALNKAGVGE